MQVDTLILGAGAAGMMCAAHCGGRVLIIDHAKAPGEKIRISGGGRCNFTNLHSGPHAFISENPHFCKSALARYTQWDFIDLVNAHGISWHEKTLGQLFCDSSAKDIINMLLKLMEDAGAGLWLETAVKSCVREGEGFRTTLLRNGREIAVSSEKLVLATGGKSIPKMGATGLSYDIARHFGLRVTDVRPALVPYTFPDKLFADLSGVSLPARVTTEDGTSFDEALLFTHRGLSGPAVLQSSSYWREGETISVNLTPASLFETLKTARSKNGKRALSTELSRHLPARLVDFLAADLTLSGNLADQSDAKLEALCSALENRTLKPSGTEGYRTAEVTLGGINTDDLSGKTMEAKAVPGLYVIGEAVDMTGWLGGYNFQWAWSSAMAAARALQAVR